MLFTTLRNTSITLVAALLMSGAAQAANTASASVTNFRLTLIDTDLNDGIDAVITFNDPFGEGLGTAVSSYVYTYDPDVGFGDGSSDYSAGVFQDGFIHANSASASVPFASARAVATNNSIYASASAEFMRPNHPYPTGQHAYATSYVTPLRGNSFTLSANTVLLIQGDFSLSASVGDSVSVYAYPDYARAGFEVAASISAPGGYQEFSIYEDLYSIDVFIFPSLKSQSAVGSFYGALFNGSGSSQDGYLYMDVYAVAERHFNITPVPEAEAIVLAMAGLGVVGCLAHRRRG